MSETDVRSDQHDFQSPVNMLWILQELYFCVSHLSTLLLYCTVNTERQAEVIEIHFHTL